VIQRRQHARRLRTRPDIAGVLILQPDDHAVLHRLIGKLA